MTLLIPRRLKYEEENQVVIVRAGFLFRHCPSKFSQREYLCLVNEVMLVTFNSECIFRELVVSKPLASLSSP
jgi:hypothetical protein